MPEHKTGTRGEWEAARDELGKLEAEHAELAVPPLRHRNKRDDRRYLGFPDG